MGEAAAGPPPGATGPGGKKIINLLRGWPHPSLLPIEAISRASQRAIKDPDVVVPGLCYGPDAGFEPLREEVGKWLGGFYGLGKGDEGLNGQDGDRSERICITGGASQNLACVLQVFSDPGVTRVWMVVPTYFLAMRVFEDSGCEFHFLLLSLFYPFCILSFHGARCALVCRSSLGSLLLMWNQERRVNGRVPGWQKQY